MSEGARVVRGYHASRVMEKIPDAVLLSDNCHLVEAIEREFERGGWVSVWLSEGLDDYAVLFVKPSQAYSLVFMLLDAEGKLFLMDGEEVAMDPAMALTFIRLVENYFQRRAE